MYTFKKIAGMLTLSILLCAAAHSQQTSQVLTDEDRQRIIDARTQGAIQRNEESRRNILNRNNADRISPAERRILLERGRYKKLQRKLTKENLKYLEPEFSDLKKYERFLSEANTGLIKFLPDFGCRKNLVIDASSPCIINASIPGDGTSYSFRKNIYEEAELSDLSFRNDSFQAGGFLTLGLLVKLGTSPIEDYSLSSNGLKQLVGFKPATHLREAMAQRENSVKGMKVDGSFFNSKQALVNNITYGLRSIAYRGSGIIDERRDIIVVFQVVRMYADGAVAVLWKRVQNIKSPKLKR